MPEQDDSVDEVPRRDLHSNHQDVSQGYNDPYFLTSGDTLNASLTNYVFHGSNFVNWSRSVRNTLIARNKIGFVDGTLRKPALNSPDYQKWIRNDHMVMTWIMNSMERSIGENFMFANSSHELWREFCEMYGQTNVHQLYDLYKKLTSIE